MSHFHGIVTTPKQGLGKGSNGKNGIRLVDGKYQKLENLSDLDHSVIKAKRDILSALKKKERDGGVFTADEEDWFKKLIDEENANDQHHEILKNLRLNWYVDKFGEAQETRSEIFIKLVKEGFEKGELSWNKKTNHINVKGSSRSAKNKIWEGLIEKLYLPKHPYKNSDECFKWQRHKIQSHITDVKKDETPLIAENFGTRESEWRKLVAAAQKGPYGWGNMQYINQPEGHLIGRVAAPAEEYKKVYDIQYRKKYFEAKNQGMSDDDAENYADIQAEKYAEENA